jgi:hypothetical protein
MYSALYIGWDVGGWNCDKNNKSRDALVILDSERELVGTPWRGNLRHAINEAENTQQWLESLLTLCQVEEGIIDQLPHTKVVLAIDTPLGFSVAFQQLLNGQAVSDPIGASAENPYLFRHTERFLFEHGLTPLSAIKDMIGSQATKGMHVLAKFAPQVVSTGVWSDGSNLTAIEAYPSACKKSMTIDDLFFPFCTGVVKLSKPATGIWDGVRFIDEIDHEDKRDALLCALIAWLSSNKPQALAQPDSEVSQSEGWIFVPEDSLDKDGIRNYERRKH